MIFERRIIPDLMKLDTQKEYINIQEIENRRFMYSPKEKALILGVQYPNDAPLISSHAEELADAGITNNYDSYVRGWVGTGKEYPAGVIHFAPNVVPQNASLMERAFDTIEMFKDNGALPDTVIRGFGRTWERKFSDIFTYN
ncbi:hypothetical protein LKD70_14935 [Ruminococcus sp. CLA-AA-H200]|uniref:Uncharacterized protein n=1 Tax=Ruminococcus turbiniformis TaxID=2881258 RepID=A0ABS8G271_9FIRM|nr:hypothetical protein [Ruminococcus turbiniformis]MCC2255688.1 hypothetical protein [Ruminococcus turbiniformis]